jgi:glutathione S-transferase
VKLCYSPTSPFVRKVTVVAIECGIDGRIARMPTDIADADGTLAAVNPLGKVPALITDDGVVLYDSRVICEYLDSLHAGAPLFPPAAAGAPRWLALRRQALADGVLDAGVLCRMELQRPEGERSRMWLARQQGKVTRGLDALAKEADGLAATPPTIGHIAAACALGWLDFRFPADDWRTTRPGLAEWYASFAERPSMQATQPRDG